MTLTDRQKAVLDALVCGTVATGRPPTAREVCRALGLRSPGTVAAHMRQLRRKGYVGAGGVVLLDAQGDPFHLRAATLAVTPAREIAEHLAGRPDGGQYADALRPLLPPPQK